MKQTFKTLSALAVAMLMLAITGCSNDNETTPVEIVEGEATYINLSFKSSALTRAATQAGTTEESTVNTIDILIFDTATGSLLTNYTYTSSQWTNSGNTYSINDPIISSVGARSVYAVVNLPSVWSVGSVGDMTSTVFESSTLTANLATANQFVMSSKTSQASFNFSYWDGSTGSCPASNTVSLDVQRAVAKFAMEESGSLPTDVTGGKVSNLMFALGRVNTVSYLAQYSNGNIIQDPYHTNKVSNVGYKLTAQNTVATDWMNVFAAGASLNANALYAPENTSDDTNVENKTYVAVRALFTPSLFTTGDGTSWTQSANSTSGTFYAIRLSSGNIYFSSYATAEAYFDYLKDAGIVTGDAADYILTYTDGYCYYTVYVNGDYDYNVYRNEFYRGVITEISGLGDTKPGPNDDPDPIELAYITIDINVLEWTLVDGNYTLTPQ